MGASSGSSELAAAGSLAVLGYALCLEQALYQKDIRGVSRHP